MPAMVVCVCVADTWQIPRAPELPSSGLFWAQYLLQQGPPLSSSLPILMPRKPRCGASTLQHPAPA